MSAEDNKKLVLDHYEAFLHKRDDEARGGQDLIRGSALHPQIGPSPHTSASPNLTPVVCMSCATGSLEET